VHGDHLPNTDLSAARVQISASSGLPVPLPALSLSVLFVSDLFHPIDDLAVELVLNRNMHHGSSRRSPVPVLLAGREPDHIARADLFDRSAFTLGPAAARRDDKRLPERVRMPSRARAGLESYAPD
jgi:hypothetical protein